MIKLLQREQNSYDVSHLAERLASPINLQEALKKYHELLSIYISKLENSRQNEREANLTEDYTSKSI